MEDGGADVARALTLEAIEEAGDLEPLTGVPAEVHGGNRLRFAGLTRVEDDGAQQRDFAEDETGACGWHP